MLRILVTGSRTWTDEDVIRDALGAYWYTYGTDVTLISGACPPRWIHHPTGESEWVKGADRICEEWAAVYGWTIELHPADWDNHGKRAGFLRNAVMVKRGADKCLAFIKANSNGASMTVKLAEKARIPVEIYRED